MQDGTKATGQATAGGPLPSVVLKQDWKTGEMG